MLTHPLIRGLDPDDPRTAIRRQELLASKAFLKQIYSEWYGRMVASLGGIEGPFLEIGSGGGFLKRVLPAVMTTDLMVIPGLSAVSDAHRLPFGNASIGGILMNSVLHHLASARRFLNEAARVMKPGGILVMNEPWVSCWSSFVYRWLHHEPFDPKAREWATPAGGPLTAANSALPWIIFRRDRDVFERELAEWRLVGIRPHTPFRYLLSGGVSMRSLAPPWTCNMWRILEGWLEPWMSALAMFAMITLERRA